MNIARLMSVSIALIMSACTFAQVTQPAGTGVPGEGVAAVDQPSAPAPAPHLPVRSILADAHAKLSKAAPVEPTASVADRRAEAEELARRINDALLRMTSAESVSAAQAVLGPPNTPASPTDPMPALAGSAVIEGHASDVPPEPVSVVARSAEPSLNEILAMLNRRLELVEQRLAELERIGPR